MSERAGVCLDGCRIDCKADSLSEIYPHSQQVISAVPVMRFYIEKSKAQNRGLISRRFPLISMITLQVETHK